MAKIKKMSPAELLARQLAVTQSPRFSAFLENGSDQGKGAGLPVASGMGQETVPGSAPNSDTLVAVESGIVNPIVEVPAVEAFESPVAPSSIDEVSEVVIPVVSESESENVPNEKGSLSTAPPSDSHLDELVEAPVLTTSQTDSDSDSVITPASDPQSLAAIESPPLLSQPVLAAESVNPKEVKPRKQKGNTLVNEKHSEVSQSFDMDSFDDFKASLFAIDTEMMTDYSTSRIYLTTKHLDLLEYMSQYSYLQGREVSVTFLVNRMLENFFRQHRSEIVQLIADYTKAQQTRLSNLKF